jgi:hypothetical protein
MKKISHIWMLGLCLFMILGPRAAASDFDELKRSVQLRADAIQALKQQGILREGTGGQLTASGQLSPPQQRLLDEENSERLRIFTLIAAKNGVSPSGVAAAFQKMTGASAFPATPFGTPTLPPTTSRNDSPNPSTAPAKALPVKVITRPFSTIRQSADKTAPAARDNVPAFSIFYVYRQSNGWYEVGAREEGTPLGWLSAEDAIEWKQNLIVKFTHPEGREPVLFFSKKPPLEAIARAPRSQRESEIRSLYSTIDTGTIPADFPVTAMEPRGMVDARKNFYMLPIVDFQGMDIDGREGRLLQVSALTRKRGAGNFDTSGAKPNLKGAQDIKVDVVFVMDLTRSMGPFAVKTLAMIQNTAEMLGQDAAVASALRFGFWGYRDSPEKCPGIEFNTKNFTPELQPIADFAKTLTTVEETKADSIDYEEDVFAGLADAIKKTVWRQDSIRLVVLVGDAPGRAPGSTGKGFPDGPRGTASGMDATSIRKVADASRVYVTALYLNTPKWQSHVEAGEEQFRTFSRNPNSPSGSENFSLIDASNPTIYGETALSLAKGILQSIADARSGRTQSDSGSLPGEPVTDMESARRAGQRLASNMFRGAMMEWLGSKQGVEAPPDVTGWVSDKDLKNPVRQALDVQVFLTKNQLNDLKVMLDLVVNAGIQGKVSGKDFFDSLRAVVATAARDPGKIAKAETLAQTGLVPLFLKDLPYLSTVMEMSNESWSQMSPDAQSQFLNAVLAKLRYYQVIHDDPEQWVALTEGDSPDNYVAAIPLEQLP